MGGDRITEIAIKGLRTIEDLRLHLDRLTVLIGPNGCGKSTVIEACALLQRITSPNFLGELGAIHGGLPSLIRMGGETLTLGIRADGDEGPIHYEMQLQRKGYDVAITSELVECAEGPPALIRNPERRTFREDTRGEVVDASPTIQGPLVTAIGQLGHISRPISRAFELLRHIQVHVPFDVRPYWATREFAGVTPLRDSVVVQPTDRLTRFGANLANAYLALRNRADWEETRDIIRLGLGASVGDVTTIVDPAGGRIALAVRFASKPQEVIVPATYLSDGALGFLALVAAVRLTEGVSLAAFDEPDIHLHPELVVRVTQLLEECAATRPIIVATHSDTLLDALERPSESARVCDLDSAGRMRVEKLDHERLGNWLNRYRGIGELRSGGFLPHLTPERRS
jgi:predicted ATPase